jgi:hypothetical protein
VCLLGAEHPAVDVAEQLLEPAGNRQSSVLGLSVLGICSVTVMRSP